MQAVRVLTNGALNLRCYNRRDSNPFDGVTTVPDSSLHASTWRLPARPAAAVIAVFLLLVVLGASACQQGELSAANDPTPAPPTTSAPEPTVTESPTDTPEPSATPSPDAATAEPTDEPTPTMEMPTPVPTRGISVDRKSTRLNSSHVKISYAVFCLKKKTSTPS